MVQRVSKAFRRAGYFSIFVSPTRILFPSLEPKKKLHYVSSY
jgi:hypothetical protein